jgi:hypothetical protein
VPSNEAILVTDERARHSPDSWTVASSTAKQTWDRRSIEMDLSVYESFDKVSTSNESISQTLDTIEENHLPMIIKQVPLITFAPIQYAEPIRTSLRFPSIRQPKRFFRTFWRGITARAVAMDRQNKFMSA